MDWLVPFFAICPSQIIPRNSDNWRGQPQSRICLKQESVSYVQWSRSWQGRDYPPCYRSWREYKFENMHIQTPHFYPAQRSRTAYIKSMVRHVLGQGSMCQGHGSNVLNEDPHKQPGHSTISQPWITEKLTGFLILLVDSRSRTVL